MRDPAPLSPPQPEAALRSPADAPTDPAFRWFAGGVGSWFGAWGIQIVVFSWLVVGELGASPEWVGIAQTSIMLPALLLILLGGAAADRADPRTLLILLHAAACLPIALLAGALLWGQLTLGGLILYGVAMGTVSAFTMPARDTLLSRVAGTDMMRAVTGMTAVQFGSQALGTLSAGATRWLGPIPLLALQAAVLLAGSLATMRIPPRVPPSQPASRRSAWHEIAEGLSLVARSERLGSTLLLVLAVGFFFVGPFIVAIPLLIRDFYRGGAAEISLAFMMFPLGTIAGSVVLRARGGVRRKGLAALGALLFGAASLSCMGAGLPFPGMIAATGAWGLAAAVFINCSRTLYQEAAPAAQRARVLSVYQLCFLGGAPLGSAIAGLVSGSIGTLATLQLFAGGMTLAVCGVWLFTNMSRFE
ncbi:MAG: MFS transporter [Proteobacteria bacterium]|nr:MFS transporter [Pseudomonadota bacterium]